MKKFILLLSLYIPQTIFAYPEVMLWKNSPVIALENKKQLKLEKKLLMKSPFAVVTGEKDQLSFKMNIFDEVLVYPNSRVQVLEFSDEQGFVENFYLLAGQIRYKATHRSAEKNTKSVIIKSPFFDLPIGNTVDLLIQLDMKVPQVEIRIIEGSLQLEFFSYEKKPLLRAGESVVFKGLLADDRLSLQYDYLLGGKKVPRGDLGEVKTFDASAFLQAEIKQEKLEQAEVIKRKKAQQEKLRRQKEYEDSFLCKKPFGQKDQCFWQIEKGRCYRYRCDVTGQWSGKTERPLPCDTGSGVRSCDF